MTALPPTPGSSDAVLLGLDALIKAARERQIEADIAGDSLMIVAFEKAYNRLLERRFSIMQKRDAATLNDMLDDAA